MAVLTSPICTSPLFRQNMLFVCVIAWKPEMSANELHHSHISDFVWKIISTRILQFLWSFWLTTKMLEISQLIKVNFWRLHTHTHPFNGPLSGTTRVSRYQKGKPVWILLKQETVSGSGISWALCKPAPCYRQITMSATHHSIFGD